MSVKLARLSFDDTVTVFLGRDIGAGVRQDHRDSSFSAKDGWDLTFFPEEGRFSIVCEGMREPTYVSGYGYSYELAEAPTAAPVFVNSPFGKKARR